MRQRNNLFRLIAFFSIALWVCGCGDDSKGFATAPAISLSVQFQTAGATETSITVNVQSSTRFKISTDAGWILYPAGTFSSGNHNITLTLDANTEPISRSAEVMFTAVSDEGSAICTITQQGGESASGEKNNLLDFRFLRSLNPGLSGNYIFGIGDGTIEGRIKNLAEEPSALIATFTTDGDKVWVGDVEQRSGESVNDFSKPVIYRVVAPDGSTKEYTVRITHFTGLPILYITTESGVAVQRRSVWEGATLRLEGGLDFDDIQLQDIEIKGRGNATWSVMQRKPSYNFRLASGQKVLGMPQHRRWSLLANYRDKTLLRNAVSYYVGYQCSGLEWTPKYRDVELVFNGRFAGVYQLTEQIRVDKDRVDIEELLPGDTDPEVITGGYLIEVDQYAINEADNYSFYSHYVTRTSDQALVQIIQKTPDKEDSNPTQAAWFKSYFLEVEQALYDAYSDQSPQREEKFAAAIETYLDLPSIIDQWIVYEISGTPEPHNPNSFYMYKRRGNTRLFGGPVWDFDYRSYIPDMANSWANKDAFWFKWLFDSSAFRAAVKERWNLLFPGLEAGILEFMDAQTNKLDLSMQANWELHEPYLINESFNNVNGDETVDYKKAVARMRSYISTRLLWLNININNL
jgi:hypothetical protein